MRHGKFEVGIEKINYDDVEKSQSKLKKFDVIDVGLYQQMRHKTNMHCRQVLNFHQCCKLPSQSHNVLD